MKISVIIVSYNTKDLTIASLNSLKKDPLEKEVIVIDNDSKDGSKEALRQRAKKGEIKLIENKTNTGFAKANNQGIKIAKGENIFLLNSDTVVKKGALASLLFFAENNEKIGIVAPRLLNKDGSIQSSCLYFPTITNAIKEYWFGKKGLFEKYAPKGKNPVEVECAVAAAFLITERALKEVGLLDEKYFFYFEDIDYCRRVKKAKLKIVYLPEAEIIHYHGASGKTLAKEKDQWKRLIPSSKIYHGLFKHHLLTFVIRLGQIWEKFF